MKTAMQELLKFKETIKLLKEDSWKGIIEAKEYGDIEREASERGSYIAFSITLTNIERILKLKN